MRGFKIKPVKEDPIEYEQKEIVKWYWNCDEMWMAYNLNQCKLIETEYAKGTQKQVKLDNQRYIDLVSMQQKRYDDPNAIRAVKREVKEMIKDIWYLNAYSSIHIGNDNVAKQIEKGNKIILPQNILQRIMEQSANGPFFFRLENPNINERAAVASVAEFNAPENTCYLPENMMNRMLLSEGEEINVSFTILPHGEYVKLLPLSNDFLDLQDPIQILETVFGYHYSSLSVEDLLSVPFDGKVYDFTVLETKPSPSINIIDQTLKIDFEAPTVTKEGPLNLRLGEEVEGEVEGNSFRHFKFYVKEEQKDLVIRVNVKAISGDPDLYISLENKQPDPVDNTWSAVTTGGEEILIYPNDPNRKNDATYYVGVRGYKKDSKFSIMCECLEISEVMLVKKGETKVKDENEKKANHVKCATCEHWVPEIAYSRHEIFCQRNSFKCHLCGIILKIQFKDEHWHCPKCNLVADKEDHFHCDECDYQGVPEYELQKHKEISHTPIKCKCGEEFQLEDTIIHRKWECVYRKVACKWCKLQITYKTRLEHEEKCASLSKTCEFCGNICAQRKLENHWASAHGYTRFQVMEMRKERDIVDKEKEEEEKILRSSQNRNQLIKSLTFVTCPYCEAPFDNLEGLQDHLFVCEVYLSIMN